MHPDGEFKKQLSVQQDARMQQDESNNHVLTEFFTTLHILLYLFQII